MTFQDIYLSGAKGVSAKLGFFAAMKMQIISKIFSTTFGVKVINFDTFYSSCDSFKARVRADGRFSGASSFYQIAGLPGNICTVTHMYQSHIYNGSYLPTSHLPQIKYTMKNTRTRVVEAECKYKLCILKR